jgi:hypothetical protein
MGLRAMSDHAPGQITRPRQAPKILTAPWSPWSSIFSVLKPYLLPAARTPGASDMRHAEDVSMRQGSTRGSPSACTVPNDQGFRMRQMLGQARA